MALYPDFTLFIQMANFLILLFILNIFLYKPIRGIIEKRNKEINNLGSLIEKMKREVEEREKSIKEMLIQARKEGILQKESLKEEASNYEKELLKETYKKIEEKFIKAKEELEKKLETIRRELQKEVEILSIELAERILGRRLKV